MIHFICVMLAFACGGGLITWLMIPAIQRHFSFLNRNETAEFHHTHKGQRSRLGGLAMVIAFLIISLAAQLYDSGSPVHSQIRWVIVCTTTAMFLLGFLDDLNPLGARKKLTGQILIAMLAWYGGLHIEHFKDPFSGTIYQLGWAGYALTIFWLIALPNLINLVDGMDGLAGGISLMLMGLLSYAGLTGSAKFPFPALCAAGMMGVVIGFLRFNFPPARIFMGDGGAYFLGFLVAELAIVDSNKGTVAAGLLAPLFVLALPIVDVSMAIVRRGLRGLPIFHPDRRHIHHKLLNIGYTPRRAVLTLYFASTIFLVFGIVVFWSEGRWAPVLFGIACLAFIVSARSFSFSREWFSVGRVLGNSVEMRETMHYALILSRWLEMEASRCDSVENLWQDYKFLVMKLNFSRVKLRLPDGHKEWQREDTQFPPVQIHHSQQTFGNDNRLSLEFEMEAGAGDARVFSNLCDIAAEAWQKASARWHAVNQIPVTFAARAKPAVLGPPRKISRPYVPLRPGDTPGIEQSL